VIMAIIICSPNLRLSALYKFTQRFVINFKPEFLVEFQPKALQNFGIPIEKKTIILYYPYLKLKRHSLKLYRLHKKYIK
jgi:hypothetical protein